MKELIIFDPDPRSDCIRGKTRRETKPGNLVVADIVERSQVDREAGVPLANHQPPNRCWLRAHRRRRDRRAETEREYLGDGLETPEPRPYERCWSPPSCAVPVPRRTFSKKGRFRSRRAEKEPASFVDETPRASPSSRLEGVLFWVAAHSRKGPCALWNG